MRDLAVYTPVHELILEILRRTGYGNYAKALPNGAQRSANLAMLVEKAMDYEKGPVTEAYLILSDILNICKNMKLIMAK